jgi:hypothetical protein
VNAGVAVSVFLFLGLCVGLAGLFITQGMGEAARAERELARASVGGPEVAISVGSGGRTSVSLSSAPAVAVPETPRLAGRVLVVSDLLPPLDAQVSSLLEGAFGAMRTAGLEVLGTFPSLGLDDAEMQVLGESIAELKSLRGLRPLDSDEVAHEFSEWLDEQEDDEQLLVWIEPSPEGQRPSIRVFPSPALLEDAPADYLPTIQRLLSAGT